MEEVSETYLNFVVCYQRAHFDQFVYGCIVLPVAFFSGFYSKKVHVVASQRAQLVRESDSFFCKRQTKTVL